MDKSKVAFLPTNSHAANWQPATRLLHNSLAKFIGCYAGKVVYLRPAYLEHLNKIGYQMPSNCLAYLEEAGVKKNLPMKVCKSLQLILLTYLAPAWQPWAAPSRIEQVERCQNKALKTVTGQLKSSPVETHFGTCATATAMAHEKAHRLPAAQAITETLQAELANKAPFVSPFS